MTLSTLHRTTSAGAVELIGDDVTLTRGEVNAHRSDASVLIAAVVVGSGEGTNMTLQHDRRSPIRDEISFDPSSVAVVPRRQVAPRFGRFGGRRGDRGLPRVRLGVDIEPVDVVLDDVQATARMIPLVDRRAEGAGG